MRIGFSTMVVSIPASSVKPSGADFATIWAPIAVLAPARFSITTGWPQRSLMRWPTKRAMMSVGPPGGNGTMMRMARFGKSRGIGLRRRRHDHRGKRDRNGEHETRKTPWPQSSFIPTALITFSRVSACDLMNAPNSSGLLLMVGSMPTASSFWRTSAFAITLASEA